ncbi:MAG: glycerate kinase [Treponema sp.]|jgi:glycerate kinase|nr:glycerate kinase [Treponema sp.]
MNIIVAPDSFKGNMGAPEACDLIEAGILGAAKDAIVRKIPLADGGEGTARAVTLAAGGRFIQKTVTGPLGDRVEAEFGLIDGGRTAVLDLAGASGIELVPRERLDPMKATTFGTGELVAAALDTGAEALVIGIGGSATCDGGAGMLSALGFRFLDEGGRPVDGAAGAAALERIASIDTAGADRRLREVTIRVACDVTNPLTGPAGAAAVFGPQKGAKAEMLPVLDAGLARLGEAWIRAGLARDTAQPGDGAAGGAGAALRICLGARMESGAMLVMRYAGFFGCLPGTDLVITGEGMTDGQTMGGKLCSVVAREARRAGVPAALLSGALGGQAPALFGAFDYAVSISRGQTGLEAMIRDSREDLRFAAENLVRAIQIGRKIGDYHGNGS